MSLRTVGVGSPDLASLTPLSGGGKGPSRVLLFVILSPRSGFFGLRSSGWGALAWVWRLLATVVASSKFLLRWAAGLYQKRPVLISCSSVSVDLSNLCLASGQM